MAGRLLLSGGEEIEAEAKELLDRDTKHSVVTLETESVYGSAIAFPQLARSSHFQKTYVTLWFRSWMALALNYFLQLSLVVFVGEATQIMNPLGGQMHLCDFGAILDSCEGPGSPLDPQCVGPGGTQFSPSRLYGYTQWAVQKFTKQALLDVLPDKAAEIDAHVDPGEYGMENYKCRYVCLFLFTMSVIHEIQTCIGMFSLLCAVPSSDESKISWLKIKEDKKGVSYRIGGMPIYWKLITFILVFLPKLAICHFVLLEGTLLLMDTAGILDCVLGALSLGFILSLDEMLFEAMHSRAGKHIMGKLSESMAILETEEVTADEEGGKVHAKETSWCSGALIRQLIPFRIVGALVVMGLYVGRYYEFKCSYQEDLQLWVSKDMFTPARAYYTMSDFLLNGVFHTVEKQSTPFWTMPPPVDAKSLSAVAPSPPEDAGAAPSPPKDASSDAADSAASDETSADA